MKKYWHARWFKGGRVRMLLGSAHPAFPFCRPSKPAKMRARLATKLLPQTIRSRDGLWGAVRSLRLAAPALAQAGQVAATRRPWIARVITRSDRDCDKTQQTTQAFPPNSPPSRSDQVIFIKRERSSALSALTKRSN